MTDLQARRYEGIDEQRCQVAEYAEERCALTPSNHQPFSLDLKEALGRYIIWRQMERRKQCKKRIHKQWIADMKKRLGVSMKFQVPPSLEGIQEEAQKACEEYKEKKKQALELRTEFLDLMIQTAKDQGDTKKVRALHNIKEKEQIIAALEAEICKIHSFGKQHQFLPRIAKKIFDTPIEEILSKTEYQKRVWQTLGNRYLEHDRRRMAKNKAAVCMREWLIPGSSKGRRKNRIKTQEKLESRASTGGTLEPTGDHRVQCRRGRPSGPPSPTGDVKANGHYSTY